MFGKKGRECLRSLKLGSLDRLVLDNHLQHVESLEGQIGRVDEIRRRASLDENVRLLLARVIAQKAVITLTPFWLLRVDYISLCF
jgi:hypothetical protein